MDSHRWSLVEKLFHQAADLQSADRSAFLTAACEGDEELRREVESLLAADTPDAAVVAAVARAACELTKDPIQRIPQRSRLGRYEILREIGRGGMGVMYAALDPVLGRTVALKTIRNDDLDETASSRFRREARAAAAVDHVNICQIHEIAEDNGVLFIAMEMLDGETLEARLAAGPIPLAEAISAALAILSALAAVHARDILHRDLKPANVFVTPHGIKILDFGLARSISGTASAESPHTTQPGILAGTPEYMSPEQITGSRLTRATDLFAVGSILFEMITGQRPFPGGSIAEVYHAMTSRQVPVLTGSGVVAAVDRVIHRALANHPADRYQSAEDMAADLRFALSIAKVSPAVIGEVRRVTRLIVLPFRMLRPDAETDFLAFSLPDAITNSLSGLDSLLVRSSLLGGHLLSGPSMDIRHIAAEASVDAVVTGTLLRVQDQIRVGVQLIEAPSGTLLRSHTVQVVMQDLFTIQDEIVREIIDALMLSLSARDRRMLRQDVPVNPAAYEYYLRANQLIQNRDNAHVARDMYLKSVEEDPRYAPAWARLGRCYRLIAKYSEDPEQNRAKALHAFERALELNSDLDVAHSQYAQLQADLGSAGDAMVRLLRQATRRRNSPDLFVGLVYLCRFCGLFEASIAAHEHAERLDSRICTSVTHTWFHMGAYSRCIETSAGDIGYIDALALAMLDREAEAIELLKSRERAGVPHLMIRLYLVSLRTCLEGNRAESVLASRSAIEGPWLGPEEVYYFIRHLARLGESETALRALRHVVDLGYCAAPPIGRDPWLDSLRSERGFGEIVAAVDASRHQHLERFREAGGDRVLGLDADAMEETSR